MKQMRTGVFETNSSSTHSIAICTREDYQRFVDGELMYDICDDVLLPTSSEDLKTRGYRYKTHKELGHPREDTWLETYCHDFITPSGDEMVAFGAYGYDG
ncbi:hypothetical protein [Acutalibacter sp.]|jgi:hypothetical protein|uniref:hypothetical protein n=1 Tax=Acutalibacter sp. TaxID=1918636 RepID=UPI002172DAA2|nr:hypothetical protein [Acutalibacter sp.]